jgi:hypothetical protein
MNEVKRGRGRPRNENAKATIASLQQEIADLKAHNSTDLQRMFDLLYDLGEQTARLLLGKEAQK